VQQYRRVEGGAAAFEYAHGELTAPGFEIEPQRRARRCGGCLRQAEQHREHGVAFGGKLQPSQLGIFNDARPCEHRATGFGAQRLLGRPQRFARRAGGNNDDTREINAGCRQRRRIRQMRRRNPCDGAFLC
jgi:hypothetical protein